MSIFRRTPKHKDAVETPKKVWKPEFTVKTSWDRYYGWCNHVYVDDALMSRWMTYHGYQNIAIGGNLPCTIDFETKDLAVAKACIMINEAKELFDRYNIKPMSPEALELRSKTYVTTEKDCAST